VLLLDNDNTGAPVLPPPNPRRGDPTMMCSGTIDGNRRYEILRRLSTGGMATVYLARLRGAHKFSKLVALKAMHGHHAGDAELAAMFVDEARISALLRHPNIVSTLDVISMNGSLMLVMEYIEGETLAELVARASAEKGGKMLPRNVACAIVHDVLLGLHYAHSATDDEGRPLGIIHRDVSPQNIIIGRDGLARVCDFGIAKTRGGDFHSNAETRTLRGKIAYMAPEQLQLKNAIDARVDLFSAGIVLWEVLTGKRLFDGKDSVTVVSQVLTSTIQPPSTIDPTIPAALDAIVMRALSRDPAQRFSTAKEMAKALTTAIRPANRATIGGSCASLLGRPTDDTPPVINADTPLDPEDKTTLVWHKRAPSSIKKLLVAIKWRRVRRLRLRLPRFDTAIVLFVLGVCGLILGSNDRVRIFGKEAKAAPHHQQPSSIHQQPTANAPLPSALPTVSSPPPTMITPPPPKKRPTTKR
jgi:eukaryotic-like serine/threonine-protein kinase